MLTSLLLGGEVHPTPATEKSRKSVDLAPGARNEAQSRVIRSLKVSPATTDAALQDATGLPACAFRAALTDLEGRRVVRRAMNSFGASRIELAEPAKPFPVRF